MTLNIVKIGGNVIDDQVKLTQFLMDFSKIKGPKILIHGGGKIATRMAADMGVVTKMVDGRRITDQAMLDIVTMVYGGLVNKQIVSSLQKNNCNSLGLTGADGASVLSHKRPVNTIDYGFVGDIDCINESFLSLLLANEITPVFSPLSYDPTGSLLNTNADTMASEIATGLSVNYNVNLIYCFEKPGVLIDVNDNTSVIPLLNPALYEKYKVQGLIFKGMIPKLDNAFAALHKGVKKVIICQADDILSMVELMNKGTRIEL